MRKDDDANERQEGAKHTRLPLLILRVRGRT